MAHERPPSRLAFVDVARGLAVLLMLQTHAYDAWLRPELRSTEFFRWSQLIGGLPGAFFLFLMGVSTSLASDRFRGRGEATRFLIRRGLVRAVSLLAFAFAFRFSMYLASDRPQIESVFRVDILNCLAVSLALLCPLELLTDRLSRAITATGVAAWFAIGTSIFWDGGVTNGLPEPIAGYLNGRVPNTTFPLFPWTAYAFVGHAAGTWVGGARDQALGRVMSRLLASAIIAIPLSIALDRMETLGPRYDYWWTSPNFVLAKAAVLTILLVACFVFERWSGRAGKTARALQTPALAALIQMGQTSLFIYCVHVDLVYGSRAFPGLWRSGEIAEVSRQLMALTLAMLLASYAWSWLKSKAKAPKGRAFTPLG